MNSPSRVVIEGCAIAVMDDALTEYSSGHLVIEGGAIVSIGAGAAPPLEPSIRRIDGSGCIATPGLINCHHHLYQWLTRGRAQQSNLFEWLTELYPLWAHIDVDMQRAAARAGLTTLVRSGCSTTTDHHYVFPHGAGDLLEAAIAPAQELGVRFHPCRGSMDLGRTQGGLPPDEVTEDRDAILAATEGAIDTWHDPAAGSMLRIAVAPCSPFSVTAELMREAAELARGRGVRLHTHLAETLEEQEFCQERFGVRPVEYLDELGWLGDDVWLAHCVQLSDSEIRRLAVTGTGVAHCPTSNARLGAGVAPVASLTSAGAPVGLGVDGAASNEAGELGPEIRQAMLVARIKGGPAALTARGALALATRGGARCLGRDEIGSLEPNMQADVALWRIDDLGHAGIEDPVAALVFGPPRPVEHLLVQGRTIVERGEVVGADMASIAADLDKASRRLLEAAS
jgi:cytosine/adenosine deaminase-related metal-dependent hydrolase